MASDEQRKEQQQQAEGESPKSRTFRGYRPPLREIYDKSVASLRTALAHYLKSGERPDAKARAEGLFAYPELRIDYP